MLVQGVRGHNNPKMLFMKFELKNHKKPKKTIKNRKKHVLKQQKIKNRFFATLITNEAVFFQENYGYFYIMDRQTRQT